MLDGNRLVLLRGGFGDDVTVGNESPWFGQGRIHPSSICGDSLPSTSRAACVPSTAVPGEQEVQCTVNVGPASVKRLRSNFMPSSLQHRCTWRSNSTCVAPSLSSSGLSFFPFMLPLHSGGDVFVSLHHVTLSQIISFSSVSTTATSNHFTFCSLQSWLGNGTLIFLLSSSPYE